MSMPIEGQVDDADIFLLWIETNDALGLALQWADEQEGNAANLEDIGNVAVVIHIDAVEIHLTVVVLGNLSQHGFQSLTGLAPVGIKVHDHGAGIAHDPIMGTVVGDDLLELVLIDGMYGIDGVGIDHTTLCVGGHSHQRKQETKQYFLHYDS